jgi:hypothetical protein
MNHRIFATLLGCRQVVATDGEVLAVAQGAQTRLHGYFVCLAPEALYVLLADPT